MSKDVQPEMCGTKQGNAPKSCANKIFKIYHISAPFEEPNTGDYDYCNKLNELINDYAPEFEKKHGYKIRSQYLKLSDLGVKEEVIAKTKDLIMDLSIAVSKDGKNLDLKYGTFNNFKEDENRKEVMTALKQCIASETNSFSIIPVLNLQLRSLDTGFIFTSEDINELQQLGIAVNVTCHEYKLNEERPLFQAILHNYLKAATSVTFFNESDFARAKKHADRSAFDLDSPNFKKTKDRIEERKKEWKEFGADKFERWVSCFVHEAYVLDETKVIFTHVPPTIGYTKDITFEEFQQKKSNIVVFGMIRGNKGFEAALDIAKVLKDKVTKGEITSELKNAQIIVVGNPVANRPGADLLTNILLAKYGIVLCKNVLQVEEKDIAVKILDILRSKDADVQIQEVVKHLEQERNYHLSLPIDIILNPTPEEIRTVYAKSKYAVKYDNKGWANNASSHIAPLANNCIVYTAWGINMSSDVGETNGKYNDAIQLLQDRKYGLKYGAVLSLKQINNGAKKKNFLMSGEKINIKIEI